MEFQKIFRSAIMFTVIAMLGISTGYSSESSTDKTTMKEVRQEVKEVVAAIENYSADQRDEAIEKAKVAIDDLDARIDELEGRVVWRHSAQLGQCLGTCQERFSG